MKIFVIGPEGAGKTVFAAMLSRFLVENSEKYVFSPGNMETSKHLANKLQELENGDWPKSETKGTKHDLRCNFGFNGQNPWEVSLQDYAGQDMRNLLTQETATTSKDESNLLSEIGSSDVLIYLLDLDGLIAATTLQHAAEDAWMFQMFMTKKEWENKRRVVVISKADRYRGLISEAEGNIPEMIARHWPKVSTPDFLRPPQDAVKFCCVTSVRAETILDEHDKPVSKPLIPLVSEGFETLVEAISTSSLVSTSSHDSDSGFMQTAKSLGSFSLHVFGTPFYLVKSMADICRPK
jgi:energy-coupling factor transporter ATP-binding protein EcfA2